MICSFSLVRSVTGSYSLPSAAQRSRSRDSIARTVGPSCTVGSRSMPRAA